MKASLKFREEQRPLFRAKVPISVLGLPFQSGVVAGEPKELSLNMATFFETGPSIKLSYRPNDSHNPFSLVVKTGTGKFGSPTSSPLLMSAEFNLLGTGNPSFMLHLKPQLGDFSFKKSQSSVNLEKLSKTLVVGAGSNSDDDGSIELVDVPGFKPLRNIRMGTGSGVGGDLYGRRITILPPSAASAIAGMLSGVEVAARTSLPLKTRASMNFRWGLRFPSVPAGDSGGSPGGIDFRKIPFLVMNKIGVEYFNSDESEPKPATVTPLPAWADVTDVCLSLKRQLEVLQSDNGALKTALDELRRDMYSAKHATQTSPPPSSADLNSSRYGGSKSDRRGSEKKSGEIDATEELKKSLKGAIASSV